MIVFRDKYYVTIPMLGEVIVCVGADSDKQAIVQALNILIQLDLEDEDEDYEIVSGRLDLYNELIAVNEKVKVSKKCKEEFDVR